MTLKLNKTSLRKNVARCHLSLTPAEMELFTVKVCGTLSWVKTRLRDMGSGKCLPEPCRAIYRIWKAHHGKTEGKSKKGSKAATSTTTSDPSTSTDIRSVFGLDAKAAPAMVDLVDDSSSGGISDLDLQDDSQPGTSSATGASMQEMKFDTLKFNSYQKYRLKNHRSPYASLVCSGFPTLQTLIGQLISLLPKSSC